MVKSKATRIYEKEVANHLIEAESLKVGLKLVSLSLFLQDPPPPPRITNLEIGPSFPL